MKRSQEKTSTDVHWNDRARLEADEEKVNIGDTVQRELETRFVLSVIPAGGRVLEVGCGNGHLTRVLREKAGFVDAFDFAENMVERARTNVGETNNRLFWDNLLDPRSVEPPYDAIVCVRVLINLSDFQQQQNAIENMAGMLRTGGKLILIEGYSNGFEALSDLRENISLPSLKPASINFYSDFDSMKKALEKYFEAGAEFHTGMFDFLTRVVYPLLVGADNVDEAGEFHKNTLPLAGAFNPDEFKKFARLRGLELIKR